MSSDFTPVSRRSDVILVLATAGVFLLVSLVSSLERALVFAVVFAVFLAIVQTRKPNRRGARFWAVLVALGILHAVVLSVIHLPEVGSGLVVLPFALADGLAIWALMNWIERRFPQP